MSSWKSLILLFLLQGALASGQDNPLPKLNTSVSVISFDPATCEIGARGNVHTGCMGAAIVIVARQDDHCIFDYETDACGGCVERYRCKVPVKDGRVTIKSENGGITRSFPEKRMSLVSSSGPGGLTLQIDQTGDYVQIKSKDRRSEMVPDQGATVKYRFHFYTDDKFNVDLPGAFYGPTQPFILGSPDFWPWLRTATTDMAIGDRIHVIVPARCARDLEPWVKDARKTENYFVAITLINMVKPKTK